MSRKVILNNSLKSNKSETMGEDKTVDTYDRKLEYISKNKVLSLFIFLILLQCLTSKLLYDNLVTQANDAKADKKEARESLKFYEHVNIETDRALKIQTQKRDTNDVR